MNILLWVLQGPAALLYGASGVMKVFMFDKVSADVRSFGAMSRRAWMMLGIIELLCVIGLIVPGVLHGQSMLTVVAAAALALESLVFIGVHLEVPGDAVHHHECLPGLLMAFVAIVAHGRLGGV